jgi:hypothetical protein
MDKQCPLGRRAKFRRDSTISGYPAPAPWHYLEAITPMENIVAMYETGPVKEFL